jgi:hypothetical protein
MPPTGGAGALPPTYVFEDLRGVLLDHVLRADLMLTGLAIKLPSALRGCSPARDGREPYCKWENRNRICTGRSNIRPRSGGSGCTA